MSQKKSGIIIQYINILLDFGTAIFFTPFLISSLGDAEYGLYRIVQSFAGQLSILSFGIATLVARNIVKYNTLNKKEDKENFLAMATIATAILATLVLIIGFLLSFSINTLFDNSFSEEQLILAKQLYWILITNVAVTIISDMGAGVLIAHEKFLIRNGLTTIKHVLRISALIILLRLKCGSIAIVITDLCIAVIIMLFMFFYGFVILKERIKYYYFDKSELKASVIFSFAIFLQAIVNQINQNLDSVILGSMTTPETVTMYSIALNLFTVFNSITMVFGTVFVPQATRLITTGASSKELTDLVVKPGRFAIMVGNLIISGFIIFGKEFITFWVGEKYVSAYKVAIILMIPGMLPLMQNVTNSILDAMMKRLGRSVILLLMAGINVIVSIILVKRIGYIGAAIGTATSYIIGYMILLNVHLKKSTSLDLPSMYKGILSKTLVVAICCLIIGLPLMLIKSSSIIILLLKMLLYTGFYCVAVYFFAMNYYEKETVKAMLLKLSRRNA